MDDRYRHLPPRIEASYETQPVSGPPPLPEVEETVGLTAAGQVAGFSELADGLVRDPPVPGRVRGVMRVVLVVLAVVVVGTALVSALT